MSAKSGQQFTTPDLVLGVRPFDLSELHHGSARGEAISVGGYLRT